MASRVPKTRRGSEPISKNHHYETMMYLEAKSPFLQPFPAGHRLFPFYFLSGCYDLEACHFYLLSPLCLEPLVCHQNFPSFFISEATAVFSVLPFPKMLCGTVFLTPLSRSVIPSSNPNSSMQQLWPWET